MPRFAANLSMLFTEQDFMDRFAAAAQAGFSVSSTCSPMTSLPSRSRLSWMPAS